MVSSFYSEMEIIYVIPLSPPSPNSHSPVMPYLVQFWNHSPYNGVPRMEHNTVCSDLDLCTLAGHLGGCVI